MRIKLGAIAALLALGTLLPLTPTGAAPLATADEEHCAARVMSRKASGEFVMSPTVCRSSQRAALTAIGAGAAVGYSAQATWTIGIHYDGASFTGSSFSVVGDNCFGGWLNLSGAWDNRVSSTVNGCYRVIHYDGDNLTGAGEALLGGGGNLSSLNNRANSIQYSQ